MNNNQKEQYEYDRFMFEFSKKIHEISQEYNKLSASNKHRIECEMKNIFVAQGLGQVLENINRQM